MKSERKSGRLPDDRHARNPGRCAISRSARLIQPGNVKESRAPAKCTNRAKRTARFFRVLNKSVLGTASSLVQSVT